MTEFLFVPDLRKRYGCGLRTIYRWKHDGRLPKPIQVAGGGPLRWRREDIEMHDRKMALTGTG